MSCCDFVNCSALGTFQMQYCALLDGLSERDREIEEQVYLSTPMVWIGVYVGAASLVCSMAMAADAFQGFRHRKLWFPCKFFTLNAASLTLLAVAMKLPVDLTTSMRSNTDRLAKLSSTVFMCTVMGNFMPSLGPMDNKELLMNITALGILVITITVNVCIQFYTGAIFVMLITEHALVISFMLVLLVILSFSALTVPISKKILEVKYDEKHKMASNEEPKQTGKFTVEKLKDDVKKYWMMAETGGLQFAMASSETCSAVGAICFLTAVILVEAELRQYLWYGRLLYPTSDYGWSTIIILGVQSVGVAVGTIAPTFRWLTAISFKCSKKGSISYRNEFKIENHLIQKLVEWKESPFALRIRSRKCRKFVQDTKNIILNFCIGFQIVNVLASKAVRLIPVFFINLALTCCCYCNQLKRKLMSKPSHAPHNHRQSESESGMELDLRRHALQLEGEEELPTRLLKNISDSANRLIHMEKKHQPENLLKLIQKSTSFKGVAKFDSDQVPYLHPEEQPNCWSLPMVTLTSIAMALPNIKNGVTHQLLRSVSEGLFYVRLIEKSIESKGDLVNIRNAADVVWLGVELYHKWLDKDLRKMTFNGKTSTEVLESLADTAKNIVVEFKRSINGGLEENLLHWPVKVIAANSMYRISQTIMVDCHGNNELNDEKLFEQLSVMIADILGACLTNLPSVIAMKCYCSAIEKREENVRLAARLLGETEEILKILQQHELPSLDFDQVICIDDWVCLMKQQCVLASISSSNNKRASSGSDEIITVL